MEPASFLIEHPDVIATCTGPAPKRGTSQGALVRLRDSVIAAHEGRIVSVGPQSTLADLPIVHKGREHLPFEHVAPARRDEGVIRRSLP